MKVFALCIANASFWFFWFWWTGYCAKMTIFAKVARGDDFASCHLLSPILQAVKQREKLFWKFFELDLLLFRKISESGFFVFPFCFTMASLSWPWPNMQFLKGQTIIIGNSHLLPSHFAHRIYTVAEIFIFIIYGNSGFFLSSVASSKIPFYFQNIKNRKIGWRKHGWPK